MTDEKKSKGDILPPEEKILPMIPPRAMRMAFFAAVRYQSTANAVAAFNNMLREVLEARGLMNELRASDIESERVFRLLESAEDIHALDTVKRKINRDIAEDALEEQELTSHLNRLDRQRRRMEADKKHEKFLKPDSSSSDFDIGDLSQDEQEFFEEVKHMTQPARLRQIANAITQDYIRKAGGDANMTQKDLDHIAGIWAAVEELIDKTFN